MVKFQSIGYLSKHEQKDYRVLHGPTNQVVICTNQGYIYWGVGGRLVVVMFPPKKAQPPPQNFR